MPRPDGWVREPADVFVDDPGISSTTSSRGLSELGKRRHPKALEDDVKRVKKTSVPQVNIRICGGEFELMIIQSVQGWPYVFRICNSDDVDHIFTSERIFNNMGLLRITVKGDRQSESCIFQIKISVHNAMEM